MRKKQIKKILLEDIDNNYSFDVDLNEIYNNYSEKNAEAIKERNIIHDYKKNPFKLATTYLSVALSCCVVLLCIAICFYAGVHNRDSVMYNELQTYIEKNCYEYNNDVYDTINYTDCVKMYIFKGRSTHDDEIDVIYFYSFSLDQNETVIIEIDGVKKAVSNKTYGILGRFKDDNTPHSLNFTVTLNDKTVNYSLQK